MIAYHRPATLAEALSIRAAQDVAIIAGGTDIYPAQATRRAWGEPTHKDVLDLTAIPDLDRIERSPTGWRLGALVTWSALRAAKLPPLFDGLKRAAGEVGGAQVQNRGTVLGNLITASPAGDGIPNLLTLDAQVEIAGPTPRLLPIADFLTGYRATALGAHEIAVALHIPDLPGARADFRKLGARHYLVISIVMVAAVVALEAGRIAAARIAIGACGPVAQRLPALEAALLGVPVAEAAGLVVPAHLETLAPIDDIRASAAYRRAAALTLLRDLLQEMAA
jgi:xanthine dehydrogenase small subunit